MVLETLGVDPYTPEVFRRVYTEFYEFEGSTSDSPEASRSFLCQKIIEKLQTLVKKQVSDEKIRVLSVGSGPQALEYTLNNIPEFQELRDLIEIYTVDIADIENVLTDSPHIQANAEKLPFADHIFDLVYSNHAIDFAPRNVFQEVKRVIRPGCQFIANLHHPSLITTASLHRDELTHKKRQLNQKLRFSVKLEKRTKLLQQISEIELEIDSQNRILCVVPSHIFQSEDEITSSISENGLSVSIVEVIKNPDGRENNWFYVESATLTQRINN